jgi:putative heme iron utilization protein
MKNKSIGHLVPKVLQDSAGSASKRLSDHFPRLTHAEKAKTLISRIKTGILSSLSVDGAFPFGSIVNFALDDDAGDIFFFVSTLAEHTANLEKDSKASLFVSEDHVDASGDKLAVARATLVGNISRVEKTPNLISTFKIRHPNANYVLFDDFFAYKFTNLLRVRYIAGFGEMSWVGGNDFLLAKVDPVSQDVNVTLNAIKHMNEDHSDANLLLVNNFATLPHPATSSTLLSIDKYGMDFFIQTKDGKRLTRVPFTTPLINAKQAKDAIIALTKKAKLSKI